MRSCRGPWSPRGPVRIADANNTHPATVEGLGVLFSNHLIKEKAMFKRSEKGLLTPDNCVLTVIDLQPQMLFGVANFDRQTIINNNVALAKAARVFSLPVVLTTVETKSFSGNMWPQIQAIFPKQVP